MHFEKMWFKVCFGFLIFSIYHQEASGYFRIYMAYLGENVTMVCPSSSKEPPLWTIHKSRVIDYRYRKVYRPPRAAIVIENLHRGDEGWFDCSAKTKFGVTLYSFLLLVGRKDLSKISSTQLEINLGGVAVLVCGSSGDTMWTFGHRKLPHNAALSGLNDDTLTIRGVQPSNTGTYKCYGKYEDGTDHFLTESYLKVYDHSKVSPQYVSVDEGANVRFTCDSIGPPTWHFGRGEKHRNVQFIQNYVLIENAAQYNTGPYECHGTTKDGKFAAIGDLVVHPKQNDDKCQVPALENGKLKIMRGVNSSMAVYYHCSSGYVLIGSEIQTCLDSGQWSGNLPKCKAEEKFFTSHSLSTPERKLNIIIFVLLIIIINMLI